MDIHKNGLRLQDVFAGTRRSRRRGATGEGSLEAIDRAPSAGSPAFAALCRGGSLSEFRGMSSENPVDWNAASSSFGPALAPRERPPEAPTAPVSPKNRLIGSTP
jgi:hypothetical protein